MTETWWAQDGHLCLFRRKRSGRAKPMLRSGGMSEGQLRMHQLLHATEGPSKNGLWKEWAKLSRRAAAGGVGGTAETGEILLQLAAARLKCQSTTAADRSESQSKSKLAVTQATVSRDPSDLQGG